MTYALVGLEGHVMKDSLPFPTIRVTVICHHAHFPVPNPEMPRHESCAMFPSSRNMLTYPLEDPKKTSLKYY